MEEKINIGFGISITVIPGDKGKRVSLYNSLAKYTRVITPLGDYNI